MPTILVRGILPSAAILAALTVCVLLLACGGDGDDSSSPADPAGSASPTEIANTVLTPPNTPTLPQTPKSSTSLPPVSRPSSKPITATSATRQTPGAANGLDATGTFPTPPERDFYQLARQLIPGIGEVDPIVQQNSPILEVGHMETFKLVDLDLRQLYESDFELLLVTPHAYWFFEDGLEVNQEDLESSAQEFEDHIYPSITEVFGREWVPGVDGDPHLYVISARLRGVGGYFSAADEYPKEVRPVSNEIEAIYINARFLPVGTPLFSQVLAHELQHAIHWVHDRSEETWVNEGLSELAVTVAGYPDFSIERFRRAGPASLTIWPADDVGGAENYGAASLFMHYLTNHYGGREDLRPLLSEPTDGIPGVNAFLEHSGFNVTFLNIFRDWAVANLIDENSGVYGYPDLSINFPVYRNLKIGDSEGYTTPQFANEYIRLEQSETAVNLRFDGETTAPLLPADIGDGCWWSNKGDVIDSTLTASLDLRNADNPVLAYQVWFSIEENWDFAYLEVSVDDGQTWTILATPLTRSEDPLQVSFGPGYTGKSEGWQEELVDLQPWAGRDIMVRFQYITDAAIHDHGLCVLDLRVHDRSNGTELAAQWTPNGFAWTDNVVRQGFMVQVVYEGKAGHANRVIQFPVDETNRGLMTLEPAPEARRIIAIVQPVAYSTRLPSSYTLTLE